MFASVVVDVCRTCGASKVLPHESRPGQVSNHMLRFHYPATIKEGQKEPTVKAQEEKRGKIRNGLRVRSLTAGVKTERSRKCLKVQLQTEARFPQRNNKSKGCSREPCQV